jgi:hypothetical protein
MRKLSRESAERHYKKLSAIHGFKDLRLAQKVSDFYQDLEHEILFEITGKKEYYNQFDWLKDNQERIEHNHKKGNIPKVIIDDIDNLKNWRNEGVHENNMPEPKYKNHFYTMAQTIRFFSEIPWPKEIENIINNKTPVEIITPIIIKKPKNNNILGKNESIRLINIELSNNILNNNNSFYSSINANNTQWSFCINNTHFNNNLYLILEDQNDKILYCFCLEEGAINNPEDIFNQRNDDRRRDASRIIIPINDRNFTNRWHEREYQFINHKILEINYP